MNYPLAKDLAVFFRRSDKLFGLLFLIEFFNWQKIESTIPNRLSPITRISNSVCRLDS